MKRTLLLLSLLLLVAATPTGDRVRPTDVHIAFSGIVTHVLDPAHPARAVTVRGDGHMLHRATLYLRAADIASSDIPLACDGDGTCALVLDGVRIRFAGATGRPTYEAGGSFDMLVPHMRGVTGGAMTALRDEVWADAPARDGLLSAIVDLPPGRYSATPDPTPAVFVPDLEQRGRRRFAREVFLSSRLVRPELQLFDGRAWKSIRFHQDEELIELRLTNEPIHRGGGDSHFLLIYALSASPLPTRPDLVLMPDGHSASLEGAGCPNNNIP